MDVYLVEEEFPPLLAAEIHLFDGHLAAGGFIGRYTHDASRSLTDFDKTVQINTRIARTDDHLQGGPELFVSQSLLLLLFLSCCSSCRCGCCCCGGGGSSGCSRFSHNGTFAIIQRVLILIGGAAVVVDRVAGRRPRLRTDFGRQRTAGRIVWL